MIEVNLLFETFKQTHRARWVWITAQKHTVQYVKKAFIRISLRKLLLMAPFLKIPNQSGKKLHTNLLGQRNRQKTCIHWTWVTNRMPDHRYQLPLRTQSASFYLRTDFRFDFSPRLYLLLFQLIWFSVVVVVIIIVFLRSFRDHVRLRAILLHDVIAIFLQCNYARVNYRWKKSGTEEETLRSMTFFHVFRLSSEIMISLLKKKTDRKRISSSLIHLNKHDASSTYWLTCSPHKLTLSHGARQKKKSYFSARISSNKNVIRLRILVSPSNEPIS